jgi:flavodoxin
MKTLVVYDSVYDNTEKIAKSIGCAIAGDVKTIHVREADFFLLESVDLLIIGSPTQGGRATLAIQNFLDGIPEPA